MCTIDPNVGLAVAACDDPLVSDMCVCVLVCDAKIGSAEGITSGRLWSGREIYKERH